MPVIKIHRKKLESLLGRKLDDEELSQLLFNLKSESTAVEEGLLDIEVNADRPDLFITEGLSRALKGLLDIEKGCPRLTVFDSEYALIVDDAPSRPFIGVAVVKNYNLDEETLEELIQFQEKLHLTVGRKRRKMAIGIHDMDKLPSDTLVYKMVPVSAEMVPLGSEKKMRIETVLKETPQGKHYGDLSIHRGMHPAILSGEEIISLPPVINSEITRLEPGTKNLLIDVTGNDRYTVYKTLDLIVSVLSEMQGSSIGRIRAEGVENIVLPLLGKEHFILDTRYISSKLGFQLSQAEAEEMLGKMRMDTVWLREDKLKVTVPEYRMDILHIIDLVEDIAIAYGYDRIPLTKLSKMTRPLRDPFTDFMGTISKLVTAQGFIEVNSMSLTGPEALGLSTGEEKPLKIKNPVSENLSFFRNTALIGLLQVLRESQGEPLPLRVFEASEVAYIGRKGVAVENRLGMAIMKEYASFEEIQAPIYNVLEILGVTPSSSKVDVKYFIPGRSAWIKADGIRVGVAGEVHPSVLVENKIKYPVVAGEISLNKLYMVIKNRLLG